MDEDTDSDLEKWLRSKFMTTNKIAELVGCSRQIIWKVKRGFPICPKYGQKIEEITGGAVQPVTEAVGRPWC